MIRFVIALLTVFPLTAWHGFRMVWAVWRNRPDALCVCDSSPRHWARTLLRMTGVRVVFEHLDRIDPDRAQILVANHTSWYDVLALTAGLPGRYLFVAKQELAGVPLFGRALRTCGHIFIDRADRAAAVESLAFARRTLEEQSPTVIMFPEGTRSPTGELQPFKKGAFVLAIQTGAEIVPAAISGSRHVMKKGSFLIHPGTITVRFGEPIPVTDYVLDQRNELTRRAWGALHALQASDTT